jgi:hypothetical protein
VLGCIQHNYRCAAGMSGMIMVSPVKMYNKVIVYSTELQKVCCSYVSGMIMVSPVTMCNKAVVYSTELQKVYCNYVSDMMMVTVL